MHLILHIGTEKTGTTSFQHFCHDNHAELLARGLLYPRDLGFRNHRFISFAGMTLDTADEAVRGMKLDTEEKLAGFIAEIAARLDRQLDAHQDARVCVLSSEHLHSRLRRPEQVARLRDLLAPRFESFEICIHLRPQIDVALSLASTQTRVGGAVRRGFFDQIRPENIYYNYNRLVAMWEEVFGPEAIRCIPFRAEPDFLSWLAAHLDLSLAGLARPARENEALDVQVMALVNALAASGRPERVDFRILDQLPVRQRLTLDRAMAEELQGRMTASNQTLVARRPDLEPGQLQPDWARYPETGTFAALEMPCAFGESLADLVGFYARQGKGTAPGA